MKVGILSMQNVANYGSYIQAYALKQILLKLGADDVVFINIQKGRELPGNNNKLINRLKRLLILLVRGRLIDRIKEGRYINKLEESFKGQLSFIGRITDDLESLDLVVIGSDEVFNCCQISSWGFSTQLFGNIPNAKKIVSYAASFGNTTYNKLEYYQLVEEIKNSLENLDSISVRDDNSQEIITKMGFKPYRHLDPVLIWGGEGYNVSTSIQEDYILLYSYPNRIKNKDEIDAIKEFSRRKQLPIIPILSEYSWCEKTVFPTPPLEVLTYFKKAKYVITDTFHGSIFSIISHKQFCTIIRDSNRQKLTSLLSSLSLDDRIFEKDMSLSNLLDQTINWIEVEQILERNRQEAFSYLSNSFKI